MIVYRIEHAKRGCGPFMDDELFDPGYLFGHGHWPFIDRAIPEDWGSNTVWGCKSLQQFYRWFPKFSEYRASTWIVAVYMVEDEWAVADASQVAFHSAHAILICKVKCKNFLQVHEAAVGLWA